MIKRLSIIAAAFAVIVLNGCNLSVKTTYEFDGVSMEPTIHDQDKLVVDKKYYEQNKVKTGDIIVYEYGNDSAHIKRVLGLPGELVQIKEGKFLVNGITVNPEFIFNDIPANDSLAEGITLKEDEYFVVGDNPEWSKDSRNDGPITKERIIGKVLEVNPK